MFPIDYHIHTNYTPHATGTVKDYCEVAKKLGIKEIAITNHLMIPKSENVPKSQVEYSTIKLNQIPEHIKEIEDARNRFDVKIKLGIEVDYFESSKTEIRDLINEYPFDFILGSIHFLDGFCISGMPSDTEKLFKGRDAVQIYIKYFSRLKRAIESQLFDVMSHPDIIRKYAVSYSNVPFEKYRKQVEEVVNSLVDSGVGIELNTYGYLHPVKDSYPSIEFLKICKEHGVKLITIGSDAHSPSSLGSGLEMGIEKLKSVGYNKIYLFDQRKPKELSMKK